MLDPCEMAHCECDLAVYCVDYACEHGGPHYGHVGCLPAFPKSLIVENDYVEEKDD